MSNKFNFEAFFNNLEKKTWSLGSAFKRADALPMDFYSVWNDKAEAEAYAADIAGIAYPGQILSIIEKEDEIDVIKLYYIDENRELQEVGSATLGDDKSITLDPESKILSIKGFENAGFAIAAGDKYKAGTEYFALVDGKYVKKDEAPTVDSDNNITDANCYKRIGVKLIKDDTGALSWITDDAVQIQAEISGLQTTVADHEERIGALEETVTDGFEEIDNRIEALGTVFNFVGSLTIDEFAATTDGGADNLIDTDAKIPNGDRAYRAGDVIFVTVPVSSTDSTVKYVQEYVVTSTASGLVWEAFGDPTGIAGLESRVAALAETATTHSDAIDTLNSDVNTEGSVAHTAKGYADSALDLAKVHTNTEVSAVKAIADANALAINGKAATGDEPKVVGLKEQVADNATAISELDATLNTEKTGVVARVTELENTSAKASDLQALGNDVTVLTQNLENNYDTKKTISDTYETIDNVTLVRTSVANNETAIKAINKDLTGTEDGKGSAGLKKDIADLQSKAKDHDDDIKDLSDTISEITNESTGSIALAQKAANVAQATADSATTAASDANALAQQGVEQAQAALAKANEKATLDEVKALNYATKTEAENYAKAVRGETTETVKTVNDKADAASTAASNAGTAAETAQTTADRAEGKADQALAKFADYTNTQGMNDAIADIVGENTDSKNDITIHGAKAYAKDLVDALGTTVENISKELVDLTTVMNFIGKSTTDPSTGTVTVGGTIITTPQLGDVVVYEAFEYVYTGQTDGWEIFGNVTADESRFDAIEKAIGYADVKDDEGKVTQNGSGLIKDVDDLQALTNTLNTTVGTHNTSISDNSAKIKALEDQINDTTIDDKTVKGIASRLTDVEGVAAAAATQTALNDEIEAREDAIEGLDKKITDGFDAQGTTNAALQENIDAIYKLNEDGTDSGMLTWGTF